MKTKLFFLFAVTMWLNVLSGFAQSGTCGDNLTWILTESTLTIGGTGTVPPNGPWSIYKNQIKSIVIEDNITGFGTNVFANYNILNSVYIGKGFRDMKGCYPFEGCLNLKSWIINEENPYWTTENGILLDKAKTTVWDCAKGIEGRLTIPSTVTAIGNSAFEYCAKLTEIIIPEGVMAIGEGAFADCQNLDVIYFPNSITQIGNYVFWDCSFITIDVKWVLPPASIFFNNLDIASCTLVVPDESLNAYRTADKWKDFGLILSSATDTVDSGITGTLNWTVIRNNGRGKLVINGSGIMPDYSQYYDDSGNYIDTTPWERYKDIIKEIVVEEGVENIDFTAFQSRSVKSIYISGSVENINSIYYTMIDGRNLENITVAESNVNYASENGVLFNKEKTSLLLYPNSKKEENYIIPPTVENIGWMTLWSVFLRSLTIPASVTYIDEIWGGGPNLVNINVDENNIHYASENGVLFTKNKEQLLKYPPEKQGEYYIVPSSVTTIGHSAFTGNKNIKNIIMASEIVNIGDYAFSNCRGLVSFSIPEGVLQIGRETFFDCDKLRSIFIPSTITIIGEAAFGWCYNLTSITNFSQIPQEISENVFLDVNTSVVTLYIPSDSKILYKASNIWNEFTNIIEISTATYVTENSASIEWYPVDNAANYILTVFSNIARTKIYGTYSIPASSSAPLNSSYYARTHSSVAEYILSYTIEGLSEGSSYYYTVEAIDANNEVIIVYNGEFVMSDISGEKEVPVQKISIFPNPTQTELFVKSDLPIKKVEIYSLAGSLLFSESHFNEKINVLALPKGVYLLKVHTNKGIAISKIVKE
jgi:hypothetical protein